MNQQKWEFQMFLEYRFVAVSLPHEAHLLNGWNRTHGAQGFSWRPGSVSFMGFDVNGYSPVSVELQDSYVPPVAATRIIKVPFQVEENGIILSDPLTQEWPVPIPPGNYALYFAAEPFEADWKYTLTFVPEKALPQAEIIRADEFLSPPEKLLMHAEPA
jgi:hypothetical protein